VQVQGIGTVLSSLVGMEDKLHLIIKTPLMPEIATKLFQKNAIIIRYFHAGQVFGFRSTLLSIIKEPFRLCILSYPTKIEIHNLRQHDRICCLLSAEIKLSQGLYEGLIEDISIGGCYFAFYTSRDGKFPLVKIGDEALLSFNLPGNNEGCAFNIVVRAIKCDIRSMKLGVQFLKSSHCDKDASSLSAIRDYMATYRQPD
jgi:c-di-GMP-binding flagellar brake protein YcgR